MYCTKTSITKWPLLRSCVYYPVACYCRSHCLQLGLHRSQVASMTCCFRTHWLQLRLHRSWVAAVTSHFTVSAGSSNAAPYYEYGAYHAQHLTRSTARTAAQHRTHGSAAPHARQRSNARTATSTPHARQRRHRMHGNVDTACTAALTPHTCRDFKYIIE